MTKIPANQLEVGDIIKYTYGEITYLTTKIKTSKKYKTEIVLVRVEEKNGQKKYSRNIKKDFIHEINDKGNISEHWIQQVILVSKNNPIPDVSQIRIY